jgi:ATP-dependent RNA helicase DDX42
MSRNYNFTPFSYGSSSNKPQQKSMNYGSVPPPPALTTTSRPTGVKAKSNYTSMDAISQYVIPSQNYGSRKRSAQHTDDDYFDDDETPEENLEYIPAEGSPSNKQQSDSDEEDPLDAFMAGLEKAESKAKEVKVAPAAPSKGTRYDIDDMDDEESYYQYMEDNPMAGVADEGSGDEGLEYDEDGNPIAPSKKRFIDPLPPIDHSEIEYKTFEKNFYVLHEEIAKLTKVQKDELRHKLGIKVTGAAAPAPVCSFAHFGFDDLLIKAIRKSEYVSVSPTVVRISTSF